MTETIREKCFVCKHRGKVPGSAHSRCNHPATERLESNPMLEMLAVFASVGRTNPMEADVGLSIKGNEHGIKNGWFNWPWNFDPTWLENCEGFEEKEKNND